MRADGSFAYFPDEGCLGPDSFTYRASDGALQSNTATVRIAVTDTTKPIISPISPKPGSTITSTRPTIKATVMDNTTLSKANIDLYVNGEVIAASTYTYDPSTGALTYNSPRLSLGKKTVKIVATDAAKNVGTKSWYFTIQ